MGVFTYKYTVKYFDIGRNNKLSLKSLVTILQEAAGSHSGKAGYGLNDIPKTHLTWLLLNWKVKMLCHPVWNEKLTVKTWPRAMDKLYSYRDFEVYDNKNNLVAIASSKWILVDTETKKIKRITPTISEAYGGIVNKSVFETPFDEKIAIPDQLDLNFKYTIQRRDIDTNGHLNNIHYIDIALETLNENIYNEKEFNNLEIIYKKEIKYQEKITCYYSFQNNQHIVTIKNEDNTIVHAIVKLY